MSAAHRIAISLTSLDAIGCKEDIAIRNTVSTCRHPALLVHGGHLDIPVLEIGNRRRPRMMTAGALLLCKFTSTRVEPHHFDIAEAQPCKLRAPPWQSVPRRRTSGFFRRVRRDPDESAIDQPSIRAG